jgi:hypothetical protein
MSMLDVAASDNLPGEAPTLYQLIRRHKRRASRIVRSVRDTDDIIQTSPAGIATVFVTFFQEKYQDMNVDLESVQAFANQVRSDRSPLPVPTYESPFTLKEESRAIDSGGKNRAPGRDGLSLEFYKATKTIVAGRPMPDIKQHVL